MEAPTHKAEARLTAGASLLNREIERQASRRVTSKHLLALGMHPSKVAEFERQKKPTGCLSRGMPNRRILSTKVVGDRRIEFHATKGPRSYRA